MLSRSCSAGATIVGLLLGASPLSGQDIEKCPAPLATIAVFEPQEETMENLRRFELGSPTTLIRTIVQQSNCFQVVERGQAMEAMERERQLGQSGGLGQGANVGGGQLAAADYVLTPAIQFANNNAGGVGGLVGGVIGRRTGAAVGGGLKFKSASTTMLVSDMRSGIQVASATGESKTTDFSLGVLAGALGGAVGGLGGYTSTNEGKVITKSFVETFNKLVQQVRGNPAIVAGGAAARAGAVFNEGDVIVPKIENIALLADAVDGAREVAKLKKTDELVVTGPEKDGFLPVQAAAGSGWVKKVLVGKT